MSGKSNLTNSFRSGDGSFRQNNYHEKLHYSSSSEEKIKFAGDESKDRLYEPKHNKKMMRVLTVVVYVFSVSLAAIILSLYYVFFWNPKGHLYLARAVEVPPQHGANHTHRKCSKTADSQVEVELRTPIEFPAGFLYEENPGATYSADGNEDNLIKPTDFIEGNDTDIEQDLFENGIVKSNTFFKRIKEANRIDSVKR